MTKEKNLSGYGYKVNINIFFIAILGALFMILFMFKPLGIKEQIIAKTPVLELENFETKELNQNGLLSITKGLKGLKYNNRYEIVDFDYTDNTNEHIANVVSNFASYKGETANLSGDIVYTRADGLVFETQEGSYNTKTKIAKSKTNYISYMGEHRVTGSSVQYNNALGIVDSKNVVVNYKLKER